MVEDGRFRVKKFNDQKYQLWKMQMEYYLYHKYLYLPLSKKSRKPTSMTDIEWEILDRKALGRLFLVALVAFNI